jgi:hypothetical protein
VQLRRVRHPGAEGRLSINDLDEPGFSLDLIADLAVPVGEYDNTRSLDLGQNRWSGRLGAPIVWQLGPWVPGRRTTLDNLGIGITLGYQINDNLGLTVGYKSTINDKAPGDLQMDGFMVSLIAGWHPLVEGAKRLKAE